RAGDPRLEPLGREALDRADAGLARGELLPVVALAGAERGDDAHAGHHDDRPARLVAIRCHADLPALEHDPEKHALGPDPRVVPLSGKDHAHALLNSFARPNRTFPMRPLRRARALRRANARRRSPPPG